MNDELYNLASKLIANSLYNGNIATNDELTRDVVEDYVSDAAEYHDEQNDFLPPCWSDEQQVQEVVEIYCLRHNIRKEN